MEKQIDDLSHIVFNLNAEIKVLQKRGKDASHKIKELQKADEKMLALVQLRLQRETKNAEKNDIAHDTMEQKARTKKVVFLPESIGIYFKGNKITKVTPKSQACKLDVCVGWIILEVNGEAQPNDSEAISRSLKELATKGLQIVILFKMAMIKKITFQPGPLGISFKGNRISRIAPGGQAENLGVGIGWIISEINDEMQFNNGTAILDCLEEIATRKMSATIVFDVVFCNMEGVKIWLKSLGLHKYAQMFQDEGYYNMKEIKTLSDDRIEQMIVDVGLKRKNADKIRKSLTTLSERKEIHRPRSTTRGKRGSLMKKSKYSKTMNECGFDLQGSILSYTDEKGKSKIVPLVDCTVRQSGVGTCDFQLCSKQRTYELQAPNVEEKLSWIEGIQNAINTQCFYKIRGVDDHQTTWNLSKQNITDMECNVVASVLTDNTVLTRLQLQWNNIGDEGSSAIAKSLETNSTLTYLRLNNNKIGDAGAIAIVKSFKSNSTLTEVYLTGNNITEKQTNISKKAANKHKSLKSFWI